jgi:DNA-directed RNA polymerase subunit RPC12/RpoP
MKGQCCDRIFRFDELEQDAVYECGECGTKFTRSEAAADPNYCPQDNRRGMRIEYFPCPDCGAEVEEENWEPIMAEDAANYRLCDSDGWVEAETADDFDGSEEDIQWCIAHGDDKIGEEDDQFDETGIAQARVDCENCRGLNNGRLVCPECKGDLSEAEDVA